MSSPVLLTDSGDTTYRRHTFGGAGSQGLADVAVMNMTGYDAAVLGNHDFEWSAPQLRAMIEHSDFPWVCANMVNTESGETFLPSYTIKDVQGVRIAFFGLMTDVADADPALYIGVPELGLRTLSPTDVAAKLVPELRQKADIVVLLSHLGVNLDTQLAQAVPGIDIILGGHSHTLLRTPTMVSVSEPTAFSLGTVPVVQAGAYGEYMGRTKLIFRRDPQSGRYALMSCKGEVIHIDASIPDDPEVKGLLDGLERKRGATPIPPAVTAPAK
jgi:2',3'-cyclic-nucleotide 2'-phosphodiesterase (5'-nucleotidase family)